MSSSAGTKVTQDAEAFDNPKIENPGVVTSDSLAAESIQEGGSFAADSSTRGPMEQPSRSVNTNTTDVSNATTLEAAADRPSRGDGADGYDAGASGPGTAASGGSTTATGVSRDGQDEAFKKPKGANLTEGGFDSSAPNASFTTDIGGKNDPGRVALNRFEASDVPVSGGAGARDQQITGETSFDQLGGDTSA